MKKPLLIAIAYCISCTAYSQEIQSNYLSFSAGLAMPLGGFAANNLSNQSAGFAKAGEHVSFGWTKMTSKNIGFTISLAGQLNPINLKSMLGQLKIGNQSGGFGSSLPPVITEPTSGTSYSNWNFNGKSWLTSTLQAGVYSEVPLGSNKNLTGFGRLTIGALYAKLPSLKANASNDTSVVAISQSSASAVGFAYSLGAGVKYALNRKLSVVGTLSYTGTPAFTFKNVNANISQVKYPGSMIPIYSQSVSTGNVKQAFNIANISVGLGLQL